MNLYIVSYIESFHYLEIDVPAEQYTLKTVDRAFAILRILIDSAAPLSLSEIADRAEISTSNAFRFLKTLEASGHVLRGDGKRYVTVAGAGGEIGLSRGIKLLDLIAIAEGGSLSTQYLAKAISVDVPQVERALMKLADVSVVEIATEPGAWRLSTGMMRFFRPLLNDQTLSRFIRPVMEEFGAVYGETVSWFVSHGWEQVVVEVLPSRQPIRYVLETGARQPIYLGAGGKAQLATMPEEDVAPFLDALEPVALTSFKLDKGALKEELPAIRAAGYATSDSERVEGAASVAVSVTGPEGNSLGVISIMMPKFRTTPEEIQDMGKALKARADKLFAPTSAEAGSSCGEEIK